MIQDILQKNENRDANDKQLAVLKEHFPACFKKDGSFDFERFKEEIKDKTDVVNEGYDLKFLGKSYAKLLASTDTTTIIQPDEAHNALPQNIDSENIYISGDNLDGLKHLLKSYNNSIKCIYIDPPYNTGSDGFVYQDNFNYTKENLQEKLSVSEEEAERILDLTKRGSASHSAWLMFMYPRLLLARDLLTDDGVIFISIDDNEQANLKLLCDDILGEENFIGTFPWRKRTAKSDVPNGISQDFEWIVSYRRSDDFFAGVKAADRKYFETDDLPNRPWRFHDMTTQRTARERPNSDFTIINPKNNEEFPVNPNAVWRVTIESIKEFEIQKRIIYPGDYDFLKISKPVLRYFKEDDMTKNGDLFGFKAISTFLPKDIGMSQDGTKDFGKLFSQKIFSFPKPVSLISFLINSVTNIDNDAFILDFFSGSGSTAHSILDLNSKDLGKRKFIAIQLPEILDSGNPSQKLAYDFLAENNLPTTLNYIGVERIKRASSKIKENHPNKELDLGFKHFTLVEPNQNTLDKLDTFDKNGMLADTTVLDDFGKETVLATWLNADGYGLTLKPEIIDLAGFTAYYLKKHLYLIDANFNLDSMKALLSKYEDDGNFNPENLVLFGYSFPNWSVNEMIEKNLKILNDSEKNLKINYSVRY
jgi:adenine-specific DNA-methyltransferase